MFEKSESFLYSIFAYLTSYRYHTFDLFRRHHTNYCMARAIMASEEVVVPHRRNKSNDRVIGTLPSILWASSKASFPRRGVVNALSTIYVQLPRCWNQTSGGPGPRITPKNDYDLFVCAFCDTELFNSILAIMTRAMLCQKLISGSLNSVVSA